MKKIAISVFVLCILIPQAIIGLTHHSSSRWPFVSYPMYAGAKYEGDRITDQVVTIAFDDGTTEIFDRERVGLSFWIVRANYIGPMVAGTFDGGGALDIICNEYGANIEAIIIHDTGVSVGKAGAVYREPKFLAKTEVSCKEAETAA